MMRARELWIGGAFIVALTLAAYAGTLRNEFVLYDDNVYVTDNPFTRAGLSSEGFRYAWTTFDSGNWIPLTWLSLQADAAVFGISPAAFHAINLILHCANVLLLLVWLNRTTGCPGASLAVSAIFAVHPLHVESVAWVAERKDLLSTFWMLVALLTYGRYSQRHLSVWYLATGLAFALGLLSKSMLVTFPLLLLLVDFWPLDRWKTDRSAVQGSESAKSQSTRWLLLEKAPFLLLSLADGIITIMAQRAGHAGMSALSSLERLPLGIRFGNALQAYSWYFLKTLWPSHLSPFYPHPMQELNGTAVAAGSMLLAAVSLYVILFGIRRRHLIFGWLWFLIALAPVIGLLQVGTQAYADRYSYVPHTGLIVMLVWEVRFYLSRLTLGRLASVILSVTAAVALGWITTSQVSIWRTTDTLWAQALAVDSENWFAHLQVGSLRLQRGLTDDESLQHFKTVLAYRPHDAIALNNVGWIHQARNEWSVAEEFYRKSLSIEPGQSSAIHNLVTVLKKQQRISDGLEPLKAYAQTRPTDARIQNELGLIDARQGKMEPAKLHFAQAVKSDPQYVGARNNLALALSQLGQEQAAEAELEIVLTQQPSDANAHVNIGVLKQKRGQVDAARRHFEAALKLNPSDTETLDRLQGLNRPDQATGSRKQ